MFNKTYSNTNGSSSVEEAYRQAFLPISFPDDDEQGEDGPEPSAAAKEPPAPRASAAEEWFEVISGRLIFN